MKIFINKFMEFFNLSVLYIKRRYKMKHHYLILIILIVVINAARAQRNYELKPVTVYPRKVPDTVFGNWKFDVNDYEFYGDKLILLTAEKTMEHARIMLTDTSQKMLSVLDLPDEAEKLYRDYLGYVNVMCKNHIYRIRIENDVIHLASLPVKEYKNFIMPCIDTIHQDIYFSDYQKDYPQFNYFCYNTTSKTTTRIKTVTDAEVMRGYNMEYYFLKPNEKLVALKLAEEYKVDKHKIAAAMSGLTTSVFYTPPYSPLFVIRDTVYVFDHYSNAIVKYNKEHQLIDSITISYHHPEHWRDWKHEIIVDKETNTIYALYERNGYYRLMHIDNFSGKITGSFKLTNKYVKHIKIKNGEVYYIYRPFESLQQQFIYKELITNFCSLDR